MQLSGGHTEGQQVQLKAGWLGFSASIATGIAGCIMGRYCLVVQFLKKLLPVAYIVWQMYVLCPYKWL